MVLFSPQWQSAWMQALQQSEAYRTQAATWEGALVLDIEPDEEFPRTRLFLDLHRGDCREIREAAADEECRFELAAPRAVWLDLLEKGSDPIYLVMRGKLRLVRGSKAQLLPYAKAAKALLAAAQGLGK